MDNGAWLEAVFDVALSVTNRTRSDDGVISMGLSD